MNYNEADDGAKLDIARNSFYAQMIKMDQALPKSTTNSMLKQ